MQNDPPGFAQILSVSLSLVLLTLSGVLLGSSVVGRFTGLILLIIVMILFSEYWIP